MKTLFRLLSSVSILLFALVACGNDEPDAPYVPIYEPSDSSIYSNEPLWRRHQASPYKVLAIGNSFTINAATYLPWLIDTLNEDSICVARLTRSGCSLEMHWTSHVDNTPDYDFYFSDKGEWKLSDVKTIDEALLIFDWDVIVLQQVSGWAGLYRTYQPYLDNLVSLIREANPSALIAWHYTWAYTPWTQNPEFKNYGRDAEKMYAAIMEVGDKVSESFDLRINSATLIKRMREEFPEVTNGFSEDGYHIVDPRALYALSSLWYEILISPFSGISSLDLISCPIEVDAEGLDKVKNIIKSL